MPDIQRAYNWAIQTCNAPNVGYSLTLRNQQTVNGITYYDCSSFIWYALVSGGWNMAQLYGSSYPFRTADCRSVILAAGFTELNIYNTEWKPGDIVLRILGEIPNTEGHIEMVYRSNGVGSGYTMGAHWAEVPLADQVSINQSPSDSSRYRHLFRYGGGADPDTGFGCSEYVIAAICGNWKQEGVMNPGQWEFGHAMAPPWDGLYPSIGGHGLGGWTNVQFQDGSTAMNLLNLHNYLLDHGYDDNSGPGQIEAFLNDPWWNATTAEALAYSDLDDFLHSQSTDLVSLTKAFYNAWEGLEYDWEFGNLDGRIEYAQWALEVIRTRANDTSITDWVVVVSNTTTINTEQQANNIIMLYRYLSSGGGGGGTKYNKSSIPFWMLLNYHL